MQESGIPTKIPVVWASSPDAGTFRTVPSAPPAQLGAASLQKGFPGATIVPIAAGGSWPFCQDTNGILNLVTAWLQWNQAGGPIIYDAAFSTAIGGYPKSAIIASATLGRAWLCTVDNNTTDPDTGGAGWVGIYSGFSNIAVYDIIGGVQKVSVNGGAYTTVGATAFGPIPGIASAQAEGWSGGGGSGGGSPGTGGSGGGGGGWGRKQLLGSQLSSAIPITLGAGGALLSAGGTTSLGSIASITGGGAGANGSNTGGGGGIPTGWDESIIGQPGNGGSVISSTAVMGGAGGMSPNGAPGTQFGITAANGAFNGVAGGIPGGGAGAGAASSGAGGNGNGAGGGNGRMTFRW